MLVLHPVTLKKSFNEHKSMRQIFQSEYGNHYVYLKLFAILFDLEDMYLYELLQIQMTLSETLQFVL